MLKRGRLVPIVVAGLAVFLAACGSGTPAATPAGGGQDAEKPKHGGIIRLVVPGTFNVNDPHKGISAHTQAEIWGLIGNRLARLDWVKGVPVPELAEKWEWNDPKTLTFTLRQGVRFQKESLAKGRELEASDVVASLKRVQTDKPDFLGRFLWRNVEKFEAPGKYTVKVTFKETDANFLYWAAFPTVGSIVPKEAIDRFGDNLANLEAWYGSGPFVVEPDKYRPDVSVGLKRNPDYGVGKDLNLPYLDQVEYYSIADRSTRLAALRAGQVDIGQPENAEVEYFRQRGFTIGNNSKGTIASDHLGFNVYLAPTSDWRVRKAIHLAIDRQELLAVVTDNYGCVPIIWGCRADLFLTTEDEFKDAPGFRQGEGRAKDIAEAKRLLAEAGYKPGTTLSLRMKSGAPGGGGTKYHYEQAVAIKGMLERDLGLKIEHGFGPGAYSSSGKMSLDEAWHMTNTADGAGGGLILDYNGQKMFHSTGGFNVGPWYDKKTDELIEKQARTLDLAERIKIFHEVQRYLMADQQLPVAPTARPWEWSVAAPHVRGWTPTTYALSNFTWQFDKVWLSK